MPKKFHMFRISLEKRVPTLPRYLLDAEMFTNIFGKRRDNDTEGDWAMRASIGMAVSCVQIAS